MLLGLANSGVAGRTIPAVRQGTISERIDRRVGIDRAFSISLFLDYSSGFTSDLVTDSFILSTTKFETSRHFPIWAVPSDHSAVLCG
jgi:hypothetical protein